MSSFNLSYYLYPQQALTLLDYLTKSGSERVAQQCKENAFTIQTLRDFQYVDRDGRDQGINVREKAKQLVALLRDEERLRQERALALKTKERLAGGGTTGTGRIPAAYPSRRSSQPSMAALYGEEFGRSRGSLSSFNCELNKDFLDFVSTKNKHGGQCGAKNACIYIYNIYCTCVNFD